MHIIKLFQKEVRSSAKSQALQDWGQQSELEWKSNRKNELTGTRKDQKATSTQTQVDGKQVVSSHHSCDFQGVRQEQKQKK